MLAGALDLMDDDQFRAGPGDVGPRHGISAQPGPGLFLKDLEYLRFLGFASAPDRRELILDRVDLQKLEADGGPIQRRAQGLGRVGQCIKPKDAGNTCSGKSKNKSTRRTGGLGGSSLMGGHGKPAFTAVIVEF